MFKPRQIEERKEIFERIKAKEAIGLKILQKQLTERLSNLKHKKFTDINKQFFFHTLSNCQIKVASESRGNWSNELLFLNTVSQKFLASYDSKNSEFYISYRNMWLIFEHNEHLSGKAFDNNVKDWIEEHLKMDRVKVVVRNTIKL